MKAPATLSSGKTDVICSELCLSVDLCNVRLIYMWTQLSEFDMEFSQTAFRASDQLNTLTAEDVYMCPKPSKSASCQFWAPVHLQN